MYNSSDKPYFIERLVAALCYPTGGLIGFIWMILGIFTKSSPRKFLKYHIFQSIFLAIAYWLLYQLVMMLFVIIDKIPYLRELVSLVVFPLIRPIPFLAGCDAVQVVVYSVILYLTTTAFLGLYSYLPWVSDIIKMNVRGE